MNDEEWKSVNFLMVCDPEPPWQEVYINRDVTTVWSICRTRHMHSKFSGHVLDMQQHRKTLSTCDAHWPCPPYGPLKFRAF